MDDRMAGSGVSDGDDRDDRMEEWFESAAPVFAVIILVDILRMEDRWFCIIDPR